MVLRPHTDVSGKTHHPAAGQVPMERGLSRPGAEQSNQKTADRPHRRVHTKCKCRMERDRSLHKEAIESGEGWLSCSGMETDQEKERKSK